MRVAKEKQWSNALEAQSKKYRAGWGRRGSDALIEP